MPTAKFHVPKVLDDRGVTGDLSGAAVASDVTDGLRSAVGEEESITVVVVWVVLIESEAGVAGGPAYSLRT